MTVHHPRYHKHREHRDARGARFAWALAWARGPIMNLELEQVLSQRLRRYLPRGFILVKGLIRSSITYFGTKINLQNLKCCQP